MLSILTWPFRLVASCFSSAVIGCLAPLLIAGLIGGLGVAYVSGGLPEPVATALRTTAGAVGSAAGRLVIETTIGGSVREIDLASGTLTVTVELSSDERPTAETVLPLLTSVADRVNTPLFGIAGGTIRRIAVRVVDADGTERFTARIALADLALEDPASAVEILR
jgi:hypothetical protein